jgi:hypothetical protein
VNHDVEMLTIATLFGAESAPNNRRQGEPRSHGPLVLAHRFNAPHALRAAQFIQFMAILHLNRPRIDYGAAGGITKSFAPELYAALNRRCQARFN